MIYHEEWAQVTRKAEGSHDLRAGGPRKPVVCSTRPSPKAWEPGAPMTKDRRKWTSQLNRPRENSPFLCSLVLFGSSRASVLPPCTGRGGGGSSLFSRQICNAALLWKRPHRHTQKERFSSHLGLPEPSQVDQGIRHHSPAGKWKGQPPTRTSR